MSKRKMCKWVTNACSGYGLREMLSKCPRNTNARCEIVPRKAKPKMARVKGWCDITYGAAMWFKADNMVSNAGKRIPCFISVEAKWLKGRKG